MSSDQRIAVCKMNGRKGSTVVGLMTWARVEQNVHRMDSYREIPTEYNFVWVQSIKAHDMPQHSAFCCCHIFPKQILSVWKFEFSSIQALSKAKTHKISFGYIFDYPLMLRFTTIPCLSLTKRTHSWGELAECWSRNESKKGWLCCFGPLSTPPKISHVNRIGIYKVRAQFGNTSL